MNPGENTGILLFLTIITDFTKWQSIKETKSVLFSSCPRDASVTHYHGKVVAVFHGQANACQTKMK